MVPNVIARTYKLGYLKLHSLCTVNETITKGNRERVELEKKSLLTIRVTEINNSSQHGELSSLFKLYKVKHTHKSCTSDPYTGAMYAHKIN